MQYFWWSWRGNLTLITLRSERVKVRVRASSRKGWVGAWPVTRLDPHPWSPSLPLHGPCQKLTKKRATGSFVHGDVGSVAHFKHLQDILRHLIHSRVAVRTSDRQNISSLTQSDHNGLCVVDSRIAVDDDLSSSFHVRSDGTWRKSDRAWGRSGTRGAWAPLSHVNQNGGLWVWMICIISFILRQ